MRLDELPVEVLQSVFQYIDKDIINAYGTSKRIRSVVLYNNLWRPLCEKLFRRIQLNEVPGSYRATFLEQQRINQHVGYLMDRVVRDSDMDAVHHIVTYGIRARDKLLEILDRQRPHAIPSSQDYNIKHNYWAEQILTIIRHHEALDQLSDIAKAPTGRYDITDVFTALDGFHESHVLNPVKEEIFEDLTREILDHEKDIRGASKEFTAKSLAEKLFCSSKTRGQVARSRNFLSAVLEDGMPGNDVVNICIYSHVGKMFGLTISPILLEQNNLHVSSNFARVDDPNRRDGYFVINILNQMIWTSAGFLDLINQQRLVRLLSTKPTLQQIAVANATHKANKYDLISEKAFVYTAMAKLASVVLFSDDHPQVWRAAAADPRGFSPDLVTRRDVLDALAGDVASCYLNTEQLALCEQRGHVVGRIRGSYGVVLGIDESRGLYKVLDENGLTWNLTHDEIRNKTRLMVNDEQLAERGSSIFTNALGKYFVGYDNNKCAFI